MSGAAGANEQAITFELEGETLVGVVSRPAQPAALGVVIVVGGPQYRAGSHRQFVALARALADAGHACLRFDCRGMGDSSGDSRSFEALDADIDAAIVALQRTVPEVKGIVLAGLCDGASATLMYLHRRRPAERAAAVAGLMILNPWVRTATGEAQTRVRHYYLERLTSGEFWRKLASGRVARGALAEAWAALRRAWAGRAAPAAGAATLHFTDQMAEGALAFGGATLVVTSGRDYTAKEFLLAAAADARWQQVLRHERTQHVQMPQADHTFSASGEQRTLEEHCRRWLQALRAAPLISPK